MNRIILRFSPPQQQSIVTAFFYLWNQCYVTPFNQSLIVKKRSIPIVFLMNLLIFQISLHLYIILLTDMYQTQSKKKKAVIMANSDAYDERQKENECLWRFREKVDRVNSGIEAGLYDLEMQIKQLKANKMKNIFRQPQREIKQSIVLYEDQPQIKIHTQSHHTHTHTHTYTNNHPLQQQSPCLQSSKMQLQGSFHQSKYLQQAFPPQFTTLINRISNQISLDSQFTAEIILLDSTPEGWRIKDLAIKQAERDGPVDKLFFSVDVSQIDPLQHNHHQSIQSDLYELDAVSRAVSISRKYYQIQSHFYYKLLKQFPLDTVILLFDQLTKFNHPSPLPSQSVSASLFVTVGHLASYVNMRTNNQWRNRLFVKFMRRMGVDSNFIRLEDLCSNLSKQM